MRFDTTSLAACGSTALFVLLWSGGAIFARLGLDHASPFAFLILRFALACLALALIAAYSGTWLPERGLRWPTARAGLLMIGGYSLCYLLALPGGWNAASNPALRDPRLRIVAGPERIESGWWDQADARRDYYVVQTLAGQRGWAYRTVGSDGPLLLHGWFA